MWERAREPSGGDAVNRTRLKTFWDRRRRRQTFVLQGLALVASGAISEGMRRLDEVNTAIVAGELKDLVAIGFSCCYMIAACERVREDDRAVQ